MYDPCGSQKLEGDEMIKRLAKQLGVKPQDLEEALLRLLAEVKYEKDYLADPNRERNI
jgi:hypothetical protein